MTFRKKTVLIVSSSDKGKYYLKNIFLDKSYDYQIKIMSDAASCRRELLANQYDLIVINAPLLDSSAEDLAVYIKTSTDSEVILIVKNEYYDMLAEKLHEHNIFLVSKPIVNNLFSQIIYNVMSLIATKKEYLDKIYQYEERLEEQRLVSKAKCLLISLENISEEEAHKYIEKKAMNERVKRSNIAIEIIKKYTL